MSSAESNPAGGMQGLLLRLHAALSEEDSRSAALACHDIVGDLGHECMQALTENELGKTLKSDVGQTHPRLTWRHGATAWTPFTNFTIYAIYASVTTHWQMFFMDVDNLTYMYIRLSLNRLVQSAISYIFFSNWFSFIDFVRQNLVGVTTWLYT